MKLGLLLPPLLCWAVVACSRHEASAISVDQRLTTPAVAPSPAPVARAQASATAPREAELASIYALQVPLRDETGKVRALDTFRGHPVLITMFYGSCPVACPILTSDLKRLERQIPEPLRSDVRILMVSFDPDRDTPAALARFKLERGLDDARWTLASAQHDEARELAGVLNIKYRKLDNGAFFHSSVIVLLDRQGRPQARIDGADEDASAIVRAMATLT
jgi:protein SCO1